MSKFKVGDKVKRVSGFDVFPHDINGTFTVSDVEGGNNNENISLCFKPLFMRCAQR